jgi:outer membrane protein
LTLTLTYYLNHNLALELFCCFAQASVRGADVLKSNGEIASTWLFPPALTAQYHFDGFGAFRPYVGAGVEWIHYFDEGLGDNGLVASHVKFRDSVGPVVQAGFDYDLGGGWSLGFDFKKVWLDTKITWTDTAVVTPVVAVHDLDPIIVTANLGYRFNLSDLFGRRAEPAPLK